MVRALTQQEASLDRGQVFNQHPGTPLGSIHRTSVVIKLCHRNFNASLKNLSWRYAWADTLRSEPFEASEWIVAYGGVQEWVRMFQELSSHLKERPLTKQDLRVVVGMQMLTDLQQELAASVVQTGLSIDVLKKRLHSGNFIEFFQQLPFVGRMMEITSIRLRNPQDVWVENDFIDLLFLSCAAAYADFVVAERKATHMLRQVAHQTSSGAAVFATLRELHRNLDF